MHMQASQVVTLSDDELDGAVGGNPYLKAAIEVAKFVGAAAAGDWVLGFIDGFREGPSGCGCGCECGC